MLLPSWCGALYVAPITLLTLIPLLIVLGSFLQPQPEIWHHLSHYVLGDVLLNTVILLFGVGSGVLLLGVPLAWFTAVCNFPGRAFFSWALMLPLAMPAYVLAFVQIGLFDFTGPLQTLLRSLFGSSAWFPPIRSTGGVISVLSLAFYPYVYLLARNAFLTQGKRTLEAAQLLGYSRRRAFIWAILPMARPWLICGLTLALMETLADFGAVAIFNFDTFTTAIYKAWFALFNLNAAAQLASLLVLTVLVLVVLEHRARGARQYHSRQTTRERLELSRTHRYFATLFCSTVLLLAFIIPLLQLILWSLEVLATDLDQRYWGFTLRSMLLSLLTALIVVALSLILVFIKRSYAGRLTKALVTVATLGYALPGSVLAVGIFLPIAWLDNQLIDLAAHFGVETSQILKGSIGVLLLALTVRFMAVAFQPIESAMARISRNQEDAARSLGMGERQLLWRLHLPLLRGGLLTALLMAFVDVMKEMPITLMMRPFGWDTLAIRIFEMTSEGMWEHAALPSLMIVMMGLLPVILLIRSAERPH